jgi:hypothetical protein
MERKIFKILRNYGWEKEDRVVGDEKGEGP